MTNEQAKQEAIKKAYGEHWDTVNRFVTEWGGLSYEDCSKLFGDEEFYKIGGLAEIFENDYSGYYYAKGIKDIGYNNGWIRIEPDGSNLPKQSLDCKMIVIGFKDVKIGWFDTFLDKEKPTFLYKQDRQIWEYKGVTHYKPIIPELPPIY